MTDLELILATRGDFNLIYSEMEKNFIPEEIRDSDDALIVMNNTSYKIYHVIDGDKKTGFITVWELSDFAFIEHFVIYEEFRNKGYGASTLGLLKEKYPKIVLEAEKPSTNIQKRRITFYKRNGFLQNEYPYLQPPYRKGGQGVPLMLMSYPKKLNDIKKIIKEIYDCVYGYIMI